jgi:hypothetical protein
MYHDIYKYHKYKNKYFDFFQINGGFWKLDIDQIVKNMISYGGSLNGIIRAIVNP